MGEIPMSGIHLVKNVNIPVAGKVDFAEIAKVAVSGALIGIGSTPGGVLGAAGSLVAGGISCKYIAPKGAFNYFVAGLAVVNAVDLLMESVAGGRGVIG